MNWTTPLDDLHPGDLVMIAYGGPFFRYGIPLTGWLLNQSGDGSVIHDMEDADRYFVLEVPSTVEPARYMVPFSMIRDVILVGRGEAHEEANAEYDEWLAEVV